MAQLPQKAMTKGNDDTGGFTPIPVGNYKVKMVKSEFKDTKAGDGEYLSIQLKVIEGEHKGRIVFDLLNLVNKNPLAMEIANGTLNAICEACGLRDVEDSKELHGITMGVRLGKTSGKDGYPVKNRVLSYIPEDKIVDNDLPWE